MDDLQKQIARQQLEDQKQILDVAIDKLAQWFNCETLSGGSIMISGKKLHSRTFHHIIVFDSRLPLPVGHLKRMAANYCQDLIAQRTRLLEELEQLEKIPQP